jgi:large subunit ribosomal protein L4
MAELDVVNEKNEKTGRVELDDRIFGVTVKKSLIHEAVVMQRASMRQGTASVKTRGEVSGGGRKPWRQKGTGRARHGSIRSPIWRGGGTVFGPQPRDYGYSIPKKKYRAAMHSALTAKRVDGEIVVLDQLSLPDAKTKSLAQILKNLTLSKKTLVVLPEISPDLELASRNLDRVRVISVRGLNVYDLMAHRYVVVTRDALSQIQEVWS